MGMDDRRSAVTVVEQLLGASKEARLLGTAAHLLDDLIRRRHLHTAGAG